MKVKSVSGSSYTVSNLAKTKAFYESLGFVFRNEEENGATGYVNWFWTVFEVGEVLDSAHAPRMWLSVEDVNAAHSELKKQGYDVTELEKTKLNYQFSVTDPDGYTVMLFKRK